MLRQSLIAPAIAPLNSFANGEGKVRLFDLWHIRHLTIFVRVLAAHITITYLVGEHGVIAGTGAPKLVARHQVANVDQDKTQCKNTENDGKQIQEIAHKMAV